MRLDRMSFGCNLEMSHVDPYQSSMANNLWLSRASHDPMLNVARNGDITRPNVGELGVLSFRGKGLMGDKVRLD